MDKTGWKSTGLKHKLQNSKGYIDDNHLTLLKVPVVRRLKVLTSSLISKLGRRESSNNNEPRRLDGPEPNDA